MRKIILYIAVSLDGYIAGPDDDLSFLSMVAQEGEDYGYARFINTVDTVITGRKTYDWVMRQVSEFPHADKTTYIITRASRPSTEKMIFYNGDLKALMLKLKNEPGKNVYVEGGAEIVSELLHHQLIDEFYLFIVPTLLGEGTRLFLNGIPPQTLKLTEVNSYEKGMVRLHYTRY
jgi:dihydrofolate reductase